MTNSWELSERYAALKGRVQAREKRLELAANEADASQSYDAYDELVTAADIETGEDLDQALSLLQALFEHLDHRGGWRSTDDDPDRTKDLNGEWT